MTSRLLFALTIFALILFAGLMSLSGPTGMPSLKALPHMIEHASLNPINPLGPQAQCLVVPSTPGQAPAAATANNAWQFEPSIFNASDLSGSSKRSYSDETSFGGPITYEILVHNSGDYTATNASVFDPIPSGTAYSNLPGVFCSSGHCFYTVGDNAIHWNGSVAPGATEVITLVVTTMGPWPDGTLITNTADISDGVGNAYARQAVVVSRASNFSTSTTTFEPALAGPGNEVTATIHVRNSASVPGVANVSDWIPAGLTYVPGSLIAPPGPHDDTGGLITWLGGVDAQSEATITFNATVNNDVLHDQHITNTAVITDAVYKTVYTPQAVLTVQKPADLFVQLDGPGAIEPNAALPYTITYGNSGPFAAETATQVSITLPLSTTYLDASPGGTTDPGAGSITWNVGLLPAHAKQILTVTLGTAEVALGDLLTATGRIAPIPQDTSLANNHDQWLTRFGALPNLLNGTTKSVEPASARPGDVVTYTIFIANSGLISATTTLTDPLPSGTSYISGSSTVNNVPIELYDAESNSVRWIGPTVAGGKVNLRFQAMITSSGAVINTATIDDGAGMIVEKVAAIWLRFFLPLIVR